MPQAQPVVRGFGEHMTDLRNKAREQRDLMSDLKGSYEREIEQYMLALNTEKSQRSQMQNEMISYYNDTFIPNLVSQYGPSVVEKLFEDDFPENEVVERKEKRKQAKIDSVNLQLEKTDKNYIDYLKTKEYNLDKKIKTLVRSDC